MGYEKANGMVLKMNYKNNKKNKESKFFCEGEIIEILPYSFFKVLLKDYKREILCIICGRMRKNNINVYLHDKVIVELDSYDISRGRIIYRKK